MKRLFISQPMKDKTKEEILKVRNEIINTVKDLENDEIEVIDSVLDISGNENPMWYLGKAIQLLSTADIVYFAKNWQNYRGCRIEHQCAIEYGIKTVYSEK